MLPQQAIIAGKGNDISLWAKTLMPLYTRMLVLMLCPYQLASFI